MAYGTENKKHLGGYIINLTDHGDPNTYATEVWDWMINNGIKSVIDVGCGEGHSTNYFLKKGIKCIGVEGGENAYNNSKVKEHIFLHDYVDGPFITETYYDAIWSCEFVEHVDEQYVNNFLETFKCGNNIFMTHALPGQEGYHHVNCKDSSYWIEKIENIGFKYNDIISRKLRNLTDKLHVKNTLLVFNRYNQNNLDIYN
jgi:SAM-dependent methyltransferase